ncbi:DUF885 family protein [Thermomonas sp.]|uniref:DUF885 domain-containing protein n=1 Tax=Thermomonas sp. TaxID=1971895 RepID=UPI0031F2E8C7
MKSLLLALAMLLPTVSVATTVATADQPEPAVVENATDQAFKAIYEAEWQWRIAQAPSWDEDSDNSGRPPSDHLADVSPEAQAKRLVYLDDVLKKLDGINALSLSPTNQVNFAVYHPQIEHMAAEIRFHDYEMPFNSDSSFWSDLGFMARSPMRDAAAYRAYAARLRDVPRYFGQQIVNMRAGLARGFSVPRAVLDGRDVSIAGVAQLKDPEASSFFDPYRKMPTSIPVAEQTALRAEGRAAIADALMPAFANLLTFFRNEYVPHARTTLAAEAMPNGPVWYREQIRKYTTLDLSPDEIHAIGLTEVASIRADMDAIIKQVGFKGSFGEFLTFLRIDPQFYAKTPQELLDRAAWISKRVDGEVGKLIGTLPRGRFTIVEVPPDIAPFWTAGRGGADTYWLNTFDLPSRPLYNLPALTLHESSPGHSLQGSLVREQGEVPDFRKEYISAYGEGWGLYSEWLGKEMGIYQTPYEEFGRLTYAMWRACRLVIDTGMHHKGWSRAQAITYLRDNTALSEHEVVTEVDRYISWPAQALSYKLGELTIVRLRHEAEAALGPKFDVRAFHDAVLAQGSVPLPVLETQIRAYIAKARAEVVP